MAAPLKSKEEQPRFPCELEMHELVEEFCQRLAETSQYQYHVQRPDVEQLSSLYSTPDTVFFTVIWSKPTPSNPAPKAVVFMTVKVCRDEATLETGWKQPETFAVTQYHVEFNKIQYPADTPLEDRWLDAVVQRKLKCRHIIDLGDDFLNSRLDGHGSLGASAGDPTS